MLHRYYKHVTIVKTPLLLKQGRKKKVITLRVFLLKCDYNIIVINFQSLTDHKDDILQWLCEMALTDSQAAFKSLYLTYFQRLIRFTRLYIYSIARHKAISYYRSIHMEQIELNELSIDLFIHTETTPEDDLISKEKINQLNNAIEALPAKCKTAFKLVREDKLKYKEVAAILEISVKTLEAHLATAIKKLREFLRKEE